MSSNSEWLARGETWLRDLVLPMLRQSRTTYPLIVTDPYLVGDIVQHRGRYELPFKLIHADQDPTYFAFVTDRDGKAVLVEHGIGDEDAIHQRYDPPAAIRTEVVGHLSELKGDDVLKVIEKLLRTGASN